MNEIYEINSRFNKLLKQFNECKDIKLKSEYILCMKELLKIFPKCSELDRCYMKLLNACISMTSDDYILKSEGINVKRNVYEVMIIGRKDVVSRVFPNLSEYSSIINDKLLEMCNSPCIIYWNSPHKIDLKVDGKVYSMGYEILSKGNSTRNSLIYYVNPSDKILSTAIEFVSDIKENKKKTK